MQVPDTSEAQTARNLCSTDGSVRAETSNGWIMGHERQFAVILPNRGGSARFVGRFHRRGVGNAIRPSTAQRFDASAGT